MEIAGCEISRLPEELLAAVLSLTAPRDACRSAAASIAFRAAADSDAVWARFLPGDLPPLADGELSPPPASKKELFLRLSDRPVLLADGIMSMWLERETGAKCYMLSARALQIVWGDVPEYWRWIPLPSSSHRFSEVAELLDVCWLEASSKIGSSMLSSHSAYTAYLVFKLSHRCYGLTSPHQLTSVTIGGSESKHQIRLQEDTDSDDYGHTFFFFLRKNYGHTDSEDVDAGGEDAEDGDGQAPPGAGDGVLLPRARSDGWMEVEMGEFYNEDGDDGEVSIRLWETEGGRWKSGLIVHGIEIRLKR